MENRKMDPRTTPVIVSGARTPIGKFLGGLSSFSAPQLGATAIPAALGRANLNPAGTKDVILGNAVSAGRGQAPARQAALHGGVPDTVGAMTVSRVCGSGLQAVMLAAQAIRAGDAQVIVAGGMESMSNAPHYLRGYRNGVKFGNQEIVDGLIHDGLWCAFESCHMGGHAEYTANKAGISRKDADAYAVESHKRAAQVIDNGVFTLEIVPIEIASRKGATVIDTDDPVRRDTTAESLAGLKPAFPKDAPKDIKELIVTAGNAPGLNDGAAALVVTSEAYAKENGLNILARVRAYSTGAVAPKDVFFAPVKIGRASCRE